MVERIQACDNELIDRIYCHVIDHADLCRWIFAVKGIDYLLRVCLINYYGTSLGAPTAYEVFIIVNEFQ